MDRELKPLLYPILMDRRIETWTDEEIDKLPASRTLDMFIHRHIVTVAQENHYAMPCCPPWSLDPMLLHILMRRMNQRAIGYQIGAGHGIEYVSLHFCACPFDSITVGVKTEEVRVKERGDQIMVLVCRALLKMFAMKARALGDMSEAKKRFEEDPDHMNFFFGGYDEAVEIPQK